MHRKTILIDLDGVLNEYGKEKFNENYIPTIKSGAKDFLKKLSKDYDLQLFTSRNVLLTSKWLIENGLDKYFSNITNIKTAAFLLIDDRAICFNGNFKETLHKIEDFGTYWEKSNS